jgi:exodeoxyribonuclease VII small subunit
MDLWMLSLKGEKMTSLSFEKALEDLENIVEKLEKGGLSLSESLALFEKGVKLARFLREELGKAEKKVEILLKDEKGELKEEPFELDKEAAPSEDKSDRGDNEDIPF